MNEYLTVLKKYAVFEGRARRREYWTFVAINVVIAIGLAIIDAVLHTRSMLYLIYNIGVIIPSFAVGVRRLHDTDRSGWGYFIALIPIVGAIILIVWPAQEGKPGGNRYGLNPKEVPPPPPPAPQAPAPQFS